MPNWETEAWHTVLPLRRRDVFVQRGVQQPTLLTPFFEIFYSPESIFPNFMAEFTIREATVQDAEQIAGLLQALGYPNTVAFSQQKIATLSQSAGDAVLVAEIAGRIIGVAHLHVAELFHEAGRLGRVMALVVAEHIRRSGVGKKLVLLLEKQARNAGCVKMEVTSGAHREGAHVFYGELGYLEEQKRFVKVLR